MDGWAAECTGLFPSSLQPPHHLPLPWTNLRTSALVASTREPAYAMLVPRKEKGHVISELCVPLCLRGQSLPHLDRRRLRWTRFLWANPGEGIE